MSVRYAIPFCILVTLATVARGADRYLIEFDSTGGQIPTNCRMVTWFDEVLFHNANPVPVEVKLLGVSNGGTRAGVARSFILDGGETASLIGKTQQTWTPIPPTSFRTPLWVTHLDVPDGVVIASRGDIGTSGSNCCMCLDPGHWTPTELGSFSLPVRDALTPPNVEQFHLAVGLGDLPSHLNVAIYNAGATVASASVDIASSCDNSLIEHRTVAIPADTIMQFSGFKQSDCKDYATSITLARGYNVTVKVDQPSLSYVSSVSDAMPPTSGISFSTAN